MGTLYVKQGGSMVEQGGGGSAGSTGTTVSSFANTTSSAVSLTLTASATPHTAGAWTELITSTSFAAETVILTLNTSTATANTATDTLLDIAVGGAGAETPIIQHIPIGYRLSGSPIAVFNLAIPAGSRVSGRIRSVVVSKTADISIVLLEAGSNVTAPSTCTAHGGDAANSRGTALAAVGATNTKGAWTQLVASTAATYKKLNVGVGFSSTSMTAATGLIDIGVGGAGAESVIIPNIGFSATTSEQAWPLSGYTPYTVNIPSGSRIAARFQASVTSTGVQPYIVVWGFS